MKTIRIGISILKLIYLMPFWVGCEEYLVNSLEVAQNKAARCISRCITYTNYGNSESMWLDNSQTADGVPLRFLCIVF